MVRQTCLLNSVQVFVPGTLARQSVQRVADELVADGLIHPTANPDHARAPLLELTPEGRAIYDKITALQKKWSNKLAQRMDLETIQKTHAGLQVILAHVEQVSFPDKFFSDSPGDT
jgi:DNA-binding MarR family transcriptional regulator